MTNTGHARIWKDRAVIFFIALMIRMMCGYIFFGSTDLISEVENNRLILAQDWTMVPYYPAIEALIWFGGVLNTQTSLPLAFCYKVIPIVFDALLAVLLFDIVASRGRRFAYVVGLLYALCPVPIIIICFHVQWDSITLFLLLLAFHIRECYREGPCSSFCFGFLFGLSALIKPMVLIFIFIFPRREKPGELVQIRRQIFGFAGLGAVLGIGVLMLYVFEYPLYDVIHGITSYVSDTLPKFGLPFGPFSAPTKFLLSQRTVLTVVLGLSLLYVVRRIDVFSVMAGSFAFIYVASGLAPQYLMWIVPCFLAAARLRFGAVYVVMITAFLLLYYFNGYDERNLGTFVTLKDFSWLMPSQSMALSTWRSVTDVIGNIALPLLSALFVISIVISAFRSRRESDAGALLPRFVPWKNAYLWSIALIASIIWITVISFSRVDMLARFDGLVVEKVSRYGLSLVDGAPSYGPELIELYPLTSNLNIVTILFGLAVCWGVFALTVRRRGIEKNVMSPVE